MVNRLSLFVALTACLAPAGGAGTALQDGTFVAPSNLVNPSPALGRPYTVRWTNNQDPSTSAVKALNLQLGVGTGTTVSVKTPSIGQVPWPSVTAFNYTFPPDLDPAAQYTIVWQALGGANSSVLGTAYVTWFNVTVPPGLSPPANSTSNSNATSSNHTSSVPTLQVYTPTSPSQTLPSSTGADVAMFALAPFLIFAVAGFNW